MSKTWTTQEVIDLCKKALNETFPENILSEDDEENWIKKHIKDEDKD